jgi:hypothetical protein
MFVLACPQKIAEEFGVLDKKFKSLPSIFGFTLIRAKK